MKTWFENYIIEDQPLFDVDTDELLIGLINEGHPIDYAIELIEGECHVKLNFNM